MATHANDNDELSFVTLAACTRNVVEFLQNSFDKSDDRAEQGSERTEKDDEKSKRDYIAERVAAIEKFERKARGEDAPRRKRN